MDLNHSLSAVSVTWERWFPEQHREVQAKEERATGRGTKAKLFKHGLDVTARACKDDTRHLKTKDLLDSQEGPVLSKLLLAEKIKERRYRKWRVDTVVLKF